MKNTCLVLAVLCLATLSCTETLSEPDNVFPEELLIPRKDISLTVSQVEYAKTGAAEFALNLFKEVSGYEDVVISPLGVFFSLAMVNNGAEDRTKQQIEHVLGYDGSSADLLNSYCEKMISSVGEIDPSIQIKTANAMIVNNARGTLNDGFKNDIMEIFSAEVFNLDFEANDVKSLINRWCYEKTSGMIPKILDSQPSVLDFAHCLNGMYFKGIWTSRFKKNDTRVEDFRDIEGKKQKVKMMHQEAHFNYAVVPNVCIALALPFGNQAFQMRILLPEGGGIDNLKGVLDLALWDDVSHRLHDERVDVKIPSFESVSELTLKTDLQNLGITDAFDLSCARFGPMSDRSVYIDDVIHNARISIDEQGAEASAITDVIMPSSSMGSIGGEKSAVAFHANRPFIYAIVEASTGAIVFIGQYTGRN